MTNSNTDMGGCVCLLIIFVAGFFVLLTYFWTANNIAQEACDWAVEWTAQQYIVAEGESVELTDLESTVDSNMPRGLHKWFRPDDFTIALNKKYFMKDGLILNLKRRD